MPYKIERSGETNVAVECADGTHATKEAADLAIAELSNAEQSKRSMYSEGETPDVLFRGGMVENAGEKETSFQLAVSSEFAGTQIAGKKHAALGIAKEGEPFLEVLSHRAEDVDLSRFNSGMASFLDEHDDKRHLGPVKRATLSEDGIVRAVVECDKVSRLSKTRCSQLAKQSRKGVSMGYAHTRYLGKETMADGKIAHRFAWRGLEVSTVSVPLDPTVGLNRAAKDECSCFSCGTKTKRASMVRGADNALYCSQDCCDANESDDDVDEARSEKGNEKMFRSKKDDGKEVRISHNELKSKVSNALNSDKRFKVKRDNGDVHSDFYLHDIHQIEDGERNYQAIVQSPAWTSTAKFHAVDFNYDGAEVTLGDSMEVQPKQTFEAVERSFKGSLSQFKIVDSKKLTNTENKNTETNKRNFMAKNIAELTAENPELATAIRGEVETQTRATITGEVNKRKTTIEARNKEVRSRADEAVKTYGKRWNGKLGEVFVVGEAIRRLEAEVCAKDETVDAVEARKDFSRGLDLLIEGSREPRNIEEAGTVNQNLADSCSLSRLWKKATEAFEKGDRRPCFLLADGAENEADKELRNMALHFPGGLGYAPEGQLFPSNSRGHAPEHVRRSMGERMKRDGLMGDFPSAGALVAPEYMTPIELLRNKLALAKAGATMFHGVVGNPLTFPRLAAPSTAQSLAEGAAAAYYDQVFDQVKLTPHRIGSSQKYSRLAASQAPNFESIVWDDHMQIHALKADYLGINGAGGNDEPLGILNQVGIGAVLFGGSSANAFKNIFGPTGLETLIRKANIDEAPAFLSTSVGRGSLMITPATLTGSTVVSGASAALLVNDKLGGRTFEDSQQIPNDLLLAIVGRHLLFASWAGMNVVLDTISLAEQDKFKLSVNQYIDWGLRHPQAVARSVDSIAALA